MEQIKEQIRQFIAESFSYAADQILDDTPLLESDIIDSTGVMELVFFVGEQFQVEVDAADLTPQNFNTINGLSDYLQTRIASPQLA